MTHRKIILPLALSLVFALTAHADQPHWKTYSIATVISQFDPDGEQQIISRPTVMTIEGQTATITTGKQVSIPIEADEVVEVLTGVTCRFTPYPLKAGGVKLDVEVVIIEDSDDMDKTIIAEKFGVRRIQQIPLGVRVVIPVSHRGMKSKHHLEVTVTEVVQPVARDEVPPPPRIGRRPKTVPPADRLNFNSEDLRKLRKQWEKFWSLDPQLPGAPFRTHGGIL